MSSDRSVDAAAVIDDFARRSPEGYRLAQHACLAVTVDLAMLRDIRTQLVPNCPVSAEVDLWSSPLVDRRGHDRISLGLSCRVVLAERLSIKAPDKLDAQWQLLAAASRAGRRTVSNLVVIEEELFYQRFVGPHGRERTKKVLDEIEQRLGDRADEAIVTWADGLLRRLANWQREAAAPIEVIVVRRLAELYPEAAEDQTMRRDIAAPKHVDVEPTTPQVRDEPETAAADEAKTPEDERHDLDDFESRSVRINGSTKTVIYLGSGPGVIVLPEVPGITPDVAALARRLADAGFRVAVPSLFGTPGRDSGQAYSLSTMLRVCVSREFTTWATGRASPVTTWLRGLARSLHEECAGPGVGVIGMCVTGGFALAMMVDDVVEAPVLSQPSLPLPIGAKRRRDLGISDDDLDRVRERAGEGCNVMGLRFTADTLAPAERFERLREVLGDAFIGVEIDSGPGNRGGLDRRAHSVLTADFVDEPDHPTRAALDLVIDFLKSRLSPNAS